MSMHNVPLTREEEAGLRAHGLAVGTPSQLSDVFRQGVAWAKKQQGDTIQQLMREHANALRDVTGDAARWRCLVTYPTVPATDRCPEHVLHVLRFDPATDDFLVGGCGVSDLAATMDTCLAYAKNFT